MASKNAELGLVRVGSTFALLLTTFLSATVTPAFGDDVFLDDMQRRTFNFFWETTPAETGLTPDRWPSESASSIAAVGFALTAYCLGSERGWVERTAAAERTLTTLRYFDQLPQSDDPQNAAGYRGFYYHFLDMQTGHRWRATELSSVDTALLILGALTCQEYFDQETSQEIEIRQLADKLYRQVQWDWMQPRAPLIAMGWKPEKGGFGKHDYRGYNEAMFLYLLALGSPTHPVDTTAWAAFTETYQWADLHGQEHVNFPPLFGHQYAACWIDFRGIQDAYMREKGIDYFENSRRATLAHRAHAIANPGRWRDYDENTWGLTACDGPAPLKATVDGIQRQFHTYSARGVSADRVHDTGTIAPTAAGGSIAFTPVESIAALRGMRDRYGERLYERFGFRDSFNPTFRFTDVKLRHGKVYDNGWFNEDYLAIDQGPILLMAENHRTGFVWKLMRKNPYIQNGLRRAGFQGGWLDQSDLSASNDQP